MTTKMANDHSQGTIFFSYSYRGLNDRKYETELTNGSTLTFLRATMSIILVTNITQPAKNEDNANMINPLRTGKLSWKVQFQTKRFAWGQPTVTIPHVNKLVRDKVIAVMCGARGSHRQTVHIKHCGDDRENRNKLKSRSINMRLFIFFFFNSPARATLQTWHLSERQYTDYFAGSASDTTGSSPIASIV